MASKQKQWSFRVDSSRQEILLELKLVSRVYCPKRWVNLVDTFNTGLFWSSERL